MEALLTTAALARLLGCSEVTIRRWRHEGGGPVFVRQSGPRSRALYTRESVEAWLRARSYSSTSAESAARQSGQAA